VDIYILRHGRAEKRAPSGHGDEGRALTGEGRTEILGVAEFLASRDVVFGCIATSPYVRAVETAQIVAKALGKRGLLVQWEELTPGSSIEALESRISGRPEDESLLIIGHEPILGQFTGYMISHGGDAAIALGKGGLAKIRNARLDPVGGELQWLLTVRQILSMK
jgi:phosphohistidine phosphatase